MKRVAFYLRVSTGEQTTENQRRQLKQVAEHRGWDLVGVFEDAGVSGAKGRDKRPQLDFMLRQAVRGQFDVLAVWSVDRLGRSLKHLLDILGELQNAGVDLYLHQQGIDTGTPAGKAMYQMLGVFAEFERSLIQERVRAGLARAKANGVKLGAERKLSDNQRLDIQHRLSLGYTPTELADRFKVSRATIYRVKDEQL